MKTGEAFVKKYDVSSIRILASVGEPLNPEAYMWYRKNIGADQVPNHRHLVADRDRMPRHRSAGHDAEKPGSVAFPLPGFNTDIFDEEANSVPLGYGGNIVQQDPLANHAPRLLQR